jgi:cytosine/adenosine deaminase-related metal-dependent hydrolase
VNSILCEENCSGVAPQALIHRAGWVVIDPWTVYSNGYIQVENGIIHSIGTGIPAGRCSLHDHGSGVLFPAMINAHTHLELCALKGQLPTHLGFGHWVKELIKKRAMLDDTTLIAAAEAGISEIRASGCGAVGEISSLGLTRDCLLNSGLAGVWFREYLGADLSIPDDRVNNSGHIALSLAGHAPHTTSPTLLSRIKRLTRSWNTPFAIHVAESDEEMAFLTTAEGPWKAFLLTRGIDPASWGLPVKSPIRHLHNIGLLDDQTILVHALHTDSTDRELIKASGAHVCLCPRSNLALHGRLPDITGMLQNDIPLCLGTDSLANVSSLSLFDEMACLCEHFPTVSPERIFQMATLGGAAALGLSNRMGSLTPGKDARMGYLDISASTSSEVMASLVHFSEIRISA